MKEQDKKTENQFRDAISTVDEKGKRIWIYPKKPSGKFFNKRKLISYLLLVLLFVTPFIKIGGNPMLMFNVVERKFIIFGQIFWPQDLYIFALGMIILILFVSLFTVVYGRLFCGWICPQTIFMEMVFRRIEYWIEGDWKQQKRLNDGPWTKDKWMKKISKQLIFWLISFVIANLFLSYIIGYEKLFQIISEPPSEHIGGFIAILVFTSLFYLVFSQMREQVCTVVCPYGRLQGVLLDDESLTVAYDYKRGENRGKFRKNESRAETNKGDCIDCGHCVNVCPTGIDIRNGTQLECINCTACMDACDDIMDKVGLEQGLIRLTSTDRIEHKSKFRLTARMKAYSAVLVLLMCIMTALLLNRTDLEATILRTRGTMFQELDEGIISNLYDVSLVNKTTITMPVDIKVLNLDAEIKLIGDPLSLKAQDEAKGKFMVLIDKQKVSSRKMDLVLGVYSEGKLIEKVETTFLGPLF